RHGQLAGRVRFKCTQHLARDPVAIHFAPQRGRARRRRATRNRNAARAPAAGQRMLNLRRPVDTLCGSVRPRLARQGGPSMKKLVLETTAPFQGLPELVAYDEGLFAKEGLAVEWADRDKGVEKTTDISVTSPKGVNPFASHGRLLEQGQADMYNACEWGNYCRVQETSQGSRQVGRRAIVSY